MFITILLSLFLCLPGSAQINAKFDAALAEISRKYETTGLPSGGVDDPWAPTGLSGELDEDTIPSYRHMHAFVVYAFYASRRDQRAFALRWLHRYRCENWIACRDLEQVYSAALKANVLKLRKNDRQTYEGLGKKFSIHLKQAEKTKPKQMGVCNADMLENPWLELEYQILCPRQSLGTEAGFAEGTPSESQLKKKLDFDSYQAAMSSAYLKDVRHTGEKHCLQPWQTKIICAGVTELEFTYQCSRENQKEGKVSCKRIPEKGN